MKNAAAGVLPQSKPANVTVHNPASPWPVIVLIGVVSMPLFVVVAWHGLVYLLQAAGSARPERDLATLIIGLAVIGLALLVASLFVNAVLGKILDTKVEIARIRAEETARRQLVAQQPAENNRADSQLQRKLKLARLIMAQAYDFYAGQGRNYNHQDRKPWAWRNCKGARLYNEAQPVSENEAREIGRFLQENRLVVDNKINLARFPDFAGVDAHLRRRYEMPIVVNGPDFPRDNRGYMHINT